MFLLGFQESNLFPLFGASVKDFLAPGLEPETLRLPSVRSNRVSQTEQRERRAQIAMVGS
uniref:Uncharacterized protein n=1 Tax=Romanomermis culicivorax TaxID=13658 RepID=A0A915KL53_ROMCU